MINNLFKGIKVTEVKGFLGNKDDAYQLMDVYFDIWEISKPIKWVFDKLKCLNFKKINKKKELNEHSFGVIKLTQPCEFKSKYIILPDNLEVINPDEKIFSFNTDTLNVFVLLKFTM